MLELTFGDVEAVLARVHRVADQKRVAFASRIKALQKEGIPSGRGTPGRGRAGTYSFDQLLQLGLAVELLQFGITPQRAARIVKGNWWMKAEEVFSLVDTFPSNSAEELAEAKDRERWMWSLNLGELTDSGDDDHRFNIMVAGLPKQLFAGTHWRDRSIDYYETTRRAVAINTPLFIDLVLVEVTLNLNLASLAQVRDELLAREPGLERAAQFFKAGIDRNRDEAMIEREKAAADQYHAEWVSTDHPGVGLSRAAVRARFNILSRPSRNFLSRLALGPKTRLDEWLNTQNRPAPLTIETMCELEDAGIVVTREDQFAAKLTKFGRLMLEAYSVLGERDDVDPQA